MDPPPIVTPRLELVSLGPAFLGALLDGRRAVAEWAGGFTLPRLWPDEHDRRFLKLRLDQMRAEPEAQQWLVRAIVLHEDPDRAMAGHIGFHGPPEGGTLEMGYTVMPAYRRLGFAYEAALEMMRWAYEEHGIRKFQVSVSPENAPSLALAAKLGFHRTGEQVDPEDGLEYVFERDYAPEDAI